MASEEAHKDEERKLKMRPQNKANPTSSNLDVLMHCTDDGGRASPRFVAVGTYALALAPPGGLD